MNIFNSILRPEEVVSLTQRLVRIPSDWNVPTREKDALDEVCKFLDENGVPYTKQQVTEHTYNVIACYKGNKEGKKVMLNGHIDTVPPYEMDFPPYEAAVKDGFIQGRGTNDMKGAVAAMLLTLVAFHRGNIPLAGELIVTVVVGEEGQSEGTKQLIRESVTADVAIVGEPSHFDYAIAHRGLEWIQVDVKGVTAHSGVAHKGVNAISKAAKLITRLEERIQPVLDRRNHPYCGRSILNFGTITGGTQPSTVADKCSFQLDRRYIPGETPESIEQEIQDVINELKEEDPNFNASLTMLDHIDEDTYHHVPLNTAPDHPFIPILTKTITDVTKRNPEVSTKRGWTDAGLLSYYGKIPTVVCGPGKIEYSHAENEQIAVEQLLQAVNIYFTVTKEYCDSVTD
ncbi:M20 family peptidase [Bacillus sp. HMF5848]|uniref:M20 family metallopeptidase n=1 Tax=Bacillus sp. HMF5848 TaxID=2495421 RepID=UPI000F76A400|nr:M20 family metallopeptidase [Bacillus sp. HMF5848]RSK27638.1 M20 family peptidase [Bacillus sp. HMF5848]